MMTPDASDSRSGERLRQAFASHSRHWRRFDYVYPVISRRSQGLSIGINLNPDTVCNFDCVYCCVDRTRPPARRDVDLKQVEAELEQMIRFAVDGQLWQEAPFDDVPPAYRTIRDIAFSGDGEPTAFSGFEAACHIAIEARQRHGLNDAGIVVITNATLLHQPHVERALQLLDEHGGDVWGKLDAGTEAYYQRIDRSSVPFQRILDNLLMCGRRRPLTIQVMLAALHGEPIDDAEFEALTERIVELKRGGAQVHTVQLYTVARQPAESHVSPLSNEEMDRRGQQMAERLPQVSVQVFQGV